MNVYIIIINIETRLHIKKIKIIKSRVPVHKILFYVFMQLCIKELLYRIEL